MIQDRKFQATLKPKVDRAIEEWHDTQPPDFPRPIVDLDNLQIKAPWSAEKDPKSPDGQS